MIDYQAIIEQLTEDNVKTILDKLDIPYIDKGDYLVMPTYCHNHKDEEASYKLYYYKNSKIFMCYTECQGQSIFRFLKNFYDAQGYEYDWYKDVYCLITEATSYNPIDEFSTPIYKSIRDRYERKRPQELKEYPSGVLDCFIKYYPPEWLGDGITKEAMDKYNILYSISQNKIVIPHYDVHGRLVGIRGRALDEWEVENVGKYMPMRIENTWYSHSLSLNLYGLNENKENIKKSGVCYLVEGEKSVLLGENFSFPNCCVAICGSNFNKYALGILLRECHPKEIVLCFDNEELPGEDKYFNKLWSICEKYKNYCDFSFVYDRKGLTKLKDSPVDRGEEVFRELVNRRVRVK